MCLLQKWKANKNFNSILIQARKRCGAYTLHFLPSVLYHCIVLNKFSQILVKNLFFFPTCGHMKVLNTNQGQSSAWMKGHRHTTKGDDHDMITAPFFVIRPHMNSKTCTWWRPNTPIILQQAHLYSLLAAIS